MPLTLNQQRRVAAAPPRQKQTLRQQFLRQNNGLTPIVTYPVRRFSSANSATRVPGFQNVPPRMNRNPFVTRNTSKPPPAPNTNVPSFQSTVIISPISVSVGSMAVTNQPVHPDSIPSLQPYVSIYGEWTFMNIQYRFVSTAATTATGSVALAFMEGNQSTPTRMSQMVRQPDVQVTRVYENSGWVIVPTYKRDTWYTTQGVATQQPFSRNPGWLLLCAQASVAGEIGYIECKYSVKFRLPRRFPHVATNSVRHFPIDNGDDEESEYEFPIPLRQGLPAQPELEEIEEEQTTVLRVDVSSSGSKSSKLT